MSIVDEINEMMEGETGMNCIAHFIVDGEPLSKARARFTGYGSKVRAYTPERTMRGERRIKAAYLAQVGRLETDENLAFRVEIDFFNGTRQRRDVDNMIKLVLDGLNKVAWPDDVQVLEVSGRKHFVPKAEACTEVTVFVLDEGMRKPTQPCVYCSKPFRTYESWSTNPKGKKYCSRPCAIQHGMELRERVCHNCGETFHAHGKGSSTRFCSRNCASQNGREEIPCAICGTKFSQFKSWAALGRVYCSKECTLEKARMAARERRTKHFPGTCLVCGTGTTRKEYKRCNPCKLAGKHVPQ
jgi:Holliday junction resolvase RusA-like endonuclease